MRPYFSVVIPLYNKANEITRTLASVLSQTLEDFEVIIVNDGSTDQSLQKVEAFDDQRIKIVTTENKGVSHARNFGIHQASSQRIAFLDADDLWKPYHLDDLKVLFESFPNCGMYCKAYDKIKGNTLITSDYKDIPKQKKWKGVIDDYFYHSSINSLASSSSIAIPKSVFETVGTFNETYNSGEDTDMWIRIALQYPTAFDTNVSVTHNLNASEKQTHTALKSRALFDLNAYHEAETSHASLKTYLDLNRYALALQYKLEDEKERSEALYSQIDKSNLSTLQKTLYGSPKALIRLLLRFRNFLRKMKINLRLFR